MRVLRSRGVAGFALRAVLVFAAATALWLPIARWYDVALVNTANALAPQGVALRAGGGEIRFYADDARLLFGGESYALHWSITLTLALIVAGWRSSLPRLAVAVSMALVLVWVAHVVGLVVEAHTLNAAAEGLAQRSSVTRAVRGLWLATVCLPPTYLGRYLLQAPAPEGIRHRGCGHRPLGPVKPGRPGEGRAGASRIGTRLVDHVYRT